MKALIVYESMFGNTEAVARAVAEELESSFEVTVAEAADMPTAAHVDLLVIGAPTHASGSAVQGHARTRCARAAPAAPTRE